MSNLFDLVTKVGRLCDFTLFTVTFELTVTRVSIVHLVALVGELVDGDYACDGVSIELGERWRHITFEMGELGGCHIFKV